MIAELSPKFGVRQNDVPPVVLLANPDAVRAAVDAATPAANMPNVKYVSLADFLLATTYCDAPATVAPDQTLWTAVIHHRFPFAAEPLSFA